MAKQPKQQADGSARKAEGKGSLTWLSGLACGVLTAVSPGTATVLAGLLAPGLLALKLDQEPGRPVARTVLLFSMAGCVRPVMTLWNAGQSFDAALSIITDPETLATAWGGAAAGWLLAQIAPLGVRMALEAAALTQTARLRAARARIAETWGLDQAPDASSD